MRKINGDQPCPWQRALKPRKDQHDHMSTGDLVSLVDEPGLFRVHGFAINDADEVLWVDLFGGEHYVPSKPIYERDGQWRAVELTRIVGCGIEADTTVDTSIVKAGRDTSLLRQFEHQLVATGVIELLAPDDVKARKSLVERIYSAGRRCGHKVKVRTKDGVIRATSERLAS